MLPAIALGASKQRPNILYIMTDQQNVDMISALGEGYSSFVSTPNIDRLVKSGYTFTNTYCAFPLSVPSRFALLTGQSPLQFGVRGNDPDPAYKSQVVSHITKYAMGNIFRASGYDTYYGGKIHLPFAEGDKMKGNTERYGFKYIEESSREELPVTAGRFLMDRKGDKPFLLFLSFINPHDICEESWLKILPEGAAKKKMGDLAINTLKPYHVKMDALGDGPFMQDGVSNLMANPGPMKGHRLGQARWEETKDITAEQWRKYRWMYYRLVEHVDAHIGQVLDALEKSGLADNTIIVFTSDHGEMGGSHGLRGKNILFEEAMRVPFVIAGKGVQHKKDAQTLVCNGQDLLPTLCDIASITPPIELRGCSLWGVATGKQATIDRDHIFVECGNSFCVIDREGNKYTKYDQVYADGMEVFVNLKKDPLEMTNRIKSPEYAAKIAELREICAGQKAKYGFVEPIGKKSKESSGKKDLED